MPLKTLIFRPTHRQIALNWGLVVLFFSLALTIYITVFWLPYRGVNLEQCPAACSQNSDCWVPGCSPKTECNGGKCRLATGHKVFFSAAAIFFLIAAGIFWAFMTFMKSKVHLKLSDDGISYRRLLKEVDISWDEFIGISYHGVNTRLAKEATVYSITGETGIFSFIVMGLPEGTSTREIELDSFFFLHLKDDELEALLAFIHTKTGMKPEPEYEW